MWGALWVSLAATLVIGVYPEPFIRLINWSLNVSSNPAVANLMKMK
jgi:hypothetical protein